MFGPRVPSATKTLDTLAILKGAAKTGITRATRKKTKQSQFLATNLKSMAYVLFSAPLFGVRLVLTVFSRTSPPPRGERKRLVAWLGGGRAEPRCALPQIPSPEAGTSACR